MALIKIISLAAIAYAAGSVGISSYFYNRTMIRGNAKRERTQKMAGTNWDDYIPKIHEAKDWLLEQTHEDVYIQSKDNLKLHATYFPCKDSKKVVICFHGYTSEGMNDYSTLAQFYLENGYHLIIPDARAHGKSEGKNIGFGCLDRWDAKKWIDYVIERLGDDCRILLHGDSMGGATVLMTTGLELPKQVKAAVSDCAFTSAWEVFEAVLKNMYHLPAFPILHISDIMSKKKAGYALNECNAKDEVKHAAVPILFIHGDSDTFVPCSMVDELYEACNTEKKKVIIEGAGHVEACYKNPDKYETAIKEFIFPKMEEDV